MVRAMSAWQDLVAQQEEHTSGSDLDFRESQTRAGWLEHQRCIDPAIDKLAQDCMDARTPAEAHLLIRSALFQISLICFIMGRQREGAEI